jgi:predicted kinase
MNELLFTVGVSGSGKSTWVTKFLQENQDYVRINYDSIRTMLLPGTYPLGNYYDRKDVLKTENMVARIAEDTAITVLRQKRKLVIDNTNLKLSYIESWINWLEIADYGFKLFDVTVEDARHRVWKRDWYGPGIVPMRGDKDLLAYIDRQAKQYETVKNLIIEKWPDKVIT